MARTNVGQTETDSLTAKSDLEHRIRERAYSLWEADGKPHGRDVEYWERAQAMIANEASAAEASVLERSAAQGSAVGENVADENVAGAVDPGPPATRGANRSIAGKKVATKADPVASADHPAAGGKGKAAPKGRARAKPKKPAQGDQVPVR